MSSKSYPVKVTLKKLGETFEVFVDYKNLLSFREDFDSIPIYDVLVDEKIFRNERRGEVASEMTLKRVFGPQRSESCILKEIFLEGEEQVPKEFVDEKRNEKKEQIIEYIVSNSKNPGTNSKYTKTIIENEVKGLKFNFDNKKSVSSQGDLIVKRLKKIMPIVIKKSNFEIKIPSEVCSKFYGSFRSLGVITKEFFDNEGNLHLHIEVVESFIYEVEEQIKFLSKGVAEYRISSLD